MHRFPRLLAAVLLTAGAAADAQTISYTDFSDITGLTLNGAAAQAGTALRLVPSVASQAGSAFADTPLALNGSTGFSTAFQFLVTPDAGSVLGVPDGLTFLLQAQGPTALGAAGQGLGYVGLDQSVAVVFRGRAPAFIGVISGGTDPASLAVPFNPPGSVAVSEGSFYGQTEFAWIDYQPGSLKVYLSNDSTKPGSAIMSASVDLAGTLGPQAWVGFSAGNGGAYGSQDVLAWQLGVSAVPEPGALVLMLAGLGGLGVVLRRRR